MLRFDLIWLTFLLTVGRWKVVYKLQFQASGAQFSAACIDVESFQIGHLSNWKSLFTLILISQGRARKHFQRHNWPMSWHHKLELGSVPKPFLRNPSVTEFVSKKTLRIGDPPRLRTEVEKISAKITIFQLILIWLQTWTPGTRWRHLQKFKIGPPVDTTCIGILLEISLLASSVSIELLSPSVRVKSKM